MAKACEALGTPVVSGNVSLYNETEAGAVYPTPVVGMVGVLEDVERHATPGFKRAGDRVVVLGGASSDESPLAGSDYLDVVYGKVAGRPPGPDLAAEREASDLVRGMIRSGLVDTAHDLAGGGEAVALAEMALAGGIGFEYEDHEIECIVGDGRAVEILFGEEGAGFLVAVPEERWDDLQGALSRASYDVVGYTGGDRFKIGGLIDLSLNEMREAYERDLFGAPGGAEVTH
jgi:phosphoribosylformylglycinamidine synthase subunit PurL